MILFFALLYTAMIAVLVVQDLRWHKRRRLRERQAAKDHGGHVGFCQRRPAA